MEISHYTHPSQFEPLLPQNRLDEFRDRTKKIVEQSIQLSKYAHPATTAKLCELVRAMNSYYSNRIEGQSTHPKHIDNALRQHFSDKPDVAKLQRIAVAHIQAEHELETMMVGGSNPLTSSFLIQAHAALYKKLNEADRTTDDGHIIEPGKLRTETVAVGVHEPPPAIELPAFLSRLDEVYSQKYSWNDSLYIIAAAHHRIAWVHPFRDGNGRACRLQTHCALREISAGLWSVSRGLARNRDKYYALLSAADNHRQGDLDGRGNLSEKALGEWCSWFIDLCQDQVTFMTSLLGLDEMKKNIRALIAFRSTRDKDIRQEAVLPLHHLFTAGPISRGEFKQMTGLGERTAQKLLSRLIETGLVSSNGGHVGPIEFAFPLDALSFLLPSLYPEIESAI